LGRKGGIKLFNLCAVVIQVKKEVINNLNKGQKKKNTEGMKG